MFLKALVFFFSKHLDFSVVYCNIRINKCRLVTAQTGENLHDLISLNLLQFVNAQSSLSTQAEIQVLSFYLLKEATILTVSLYSNRVIDFIYKLQ